VCQVPCAVPAERVTLELPLAPVRFAKFGLPLTIECVAVGAVKLRLPPAPAADAAFRFPKELAPEILDPVCAPLKKCCCAIEWLGTDDGFTGRLTD